MTTLCSPEIPEDSYDVAADVRSFGKLQQLTIYAESPEGADFAAAIFYSSSMKSVLLILNLKRECP